MDVVEDDFKVTLKSDKKNSSIRELDILSQ